MCSFSKQIHLLFFNHPRIFQSKKNIRGNKWKCRGTVSTFQPGLKIPGQPETVVKESKTLLDPEHKLMDKVRIRVKCQMCNRGRQLGERRSRE